MHLGRFSKYERLAVTRVVRGNNLGGQGQYTGRRNLQKNFSLKLIPVSQVSHWRRDQNKMCLLLYTMSDGNDRFCFSQLCGAMTLLVLPIVSSVMGRSFSAGGSLYHDLFGWTKPFSA